MIAGISTVFRSFSFVLGFNLCVCAAVQNQDLKPVTMPAKIMENLDIAKEKGVAGPGINVREAVVSTSQKIARGAELFKTFACFTCHGDQGQGDGIAGKFLNPTPRNFHQMSGWKNSNTFVGMFKTLKEGISGTAMTAYDTIPAQDRIALIHFIRSLASGYPPVSEADIISLEKDYKLADSVAKHKIPVRDAMKIMVLEFSELQRKVEEIQKLARSQEAASVLLENVTDLESALLVFLRNDSWRNHSASFLQILRTNQIFSPALAASSREKLENLFVWLHQSIFFEKPEDFSAFSSRVSPSFLPVKPGSPIPPVSSLNLQKKVQKSDPKDPEMIALMQKRGCIACHQVEMKVVGPSYREVAGKYPSDSATAQMLVKKVQTGGSGVWGPIPMTPNAHVPQEDIQALVEWILNIE